MPELVPLASIEPARVEQLLDDAFGTDRHARTAYAVRDGTTFLDALSFAAITGETLIGTIQCWPVLLTRDAGGEVPLIMVGPVAVAPDHQRHGTGRLLMTAAIEAADARGAGEALILIGDPEYYGRFFGFSAALTTRWRLPGPFEQRRLLVRGSAIGDHAGSLGPRVAVDA